MDEKTARIVYIEDDPGMVDLVTLIVERHGYQIMGAQNGQDGLDLIFKTHPDLILLDLMMPDMDGWEVYHQVKADINTQNIPVIVVTAKSLEIDRVLGMMVARADDYITKPFKPNDLIASIDKVMAAKSAQNHQT